MGRSRYKIFEVEFPYFVTSTIFGRIPIFNNLEYVNILVESLEFYKSEFSTRIYAYVIMPDHIHLIIRSSNPSEYMRRVKSYTAKKFLDEMTDQHRLEWLNKLKRLKLQGKKRSTYQIWTEGFHPIQINSDLKMSRVVDYIHQNPVQAGLVKRAKDWSYSSARNYAVLEGVLEIDLPGDERGRSSPGR